MSEQRVREMCKEFLEKSQQSSASCALEKLRSSKEKGATLTMLYQGSTPRHTKENIFLNIGEQEKESLARRESTQSKLTPKPSAERETPPEVESTVESEAEVVNQRTFTSFEVNFTDFDKDDDLEDEINEESDSSSYSSEISWPDFDIPGTWGTYGLEDDPWDDAEKPCVRFRNYEDLELFPEEEAGILTERIIACCSSYLSRCPQTGKYVLCKCTLRNKNLSNICILKYHHYLQYLDLSWNKLTNLEALGQLPFLMYLDVSHNTLTDLLNFNAPFNLTYVNFSHNYVDIIPNLSDFWSIVYLDLSHNSVYQISGLENLRYLRYLDLSYNQITTLQGLNNMRLTHLNLQENKIVSFEEGTDIGLKTMPELIVMNLSRNFLTSLKVFEGAKVLQKLVLMDNQINCLYEIEHLRQLRYLTEVYFKGNPISTDKSYYEVCLKCITPIVMLDGEYISAEKKVLATSKYTPSPLISSGINHSDLFLIECLATCEVTNMMLPITQAPPPMMVLVGPPGSGQKKTIQALYEKHKKYVCLGVSHTTRPKNSNETDGECYYFISDEKFESMVRNAEFVTVSNILGYGYGFSYKEMMKCAEEKKVLLLHMDIVAALSLRMRNLRPYLVLTLHGQIDNYYAQLLKKYYYTYWLSRNYKALRIINDSGKIDTSSSGGISTDVEDILRDLIINLPLREYPMKKSSVKFAETEFSFAVPESDTQLGSNLSLTDGAKSSSLSDEMISLIIDSKKNDSTFNLADEEDIFHSISEVEFDFEPVLSVVSEHKIDEDQDEPLQGYTRRMRPNQRIEDFIQTILATRENYLNFHRQNPGMFCDTIFTDKMEPTMHKLKLILKRALTRKQKAWHSYNFETDPVFEKMVGQKLLALHAEMQNVSNINLEVCD